MSATELPMLNGLWADDGSRTAGRGLNPPSCSRVATITTFGVVAVSYKWDDERTPAVALIMRPGEPARDYRSGSRAIDGKHIDNRVAGALAGRVFADKSELYDALSELGFEAIITTASGGTYWRVR